MRHIEYPSIKHYRETFKQITRQRLQTNPHDPLVFRGTTKLHGTNFSYVFDTTDQSQNVFQSRKNVLTDSDEFYGFKDIVYGNKGRYGIKHVLDESIIRFFKDSELPSIFSVSHFIIFGEFIGGEIQRKIALEKLDKMFVIFDMALIIDGRLNFLSWDSLCDFSKIVANKRENFFEEQAVKSITEFPTWEVSINTLSESDMLAAQDKLSKITKEVERECPFAKAHGVKGTGEGVVWRVAQPHLEASNDGFGLRFKVKGDEHTNSKVRTLDPVESAKIDGLKSLEDICAAICTEARFNQGMQFLSENNIAESAKKSTFMRWVVEDTIKEEMDFITEKGLTADQIKPQLFKNALRFWISRT
ncbi:RNA ligase family protein [Variovorax sp. RB3P1]|uniref:RNA ligase family protein n=1 Tax=Variovorax sp. RB3P1 TaxID=3443732 RepID=UPI003F454637